MRSGERTLRLLIEPIAAFLADPATTEVVMQQPGEVGVESAGAWSWHARSELTFSRLEGIATLCAAMSQQDVGPDRPLCASVLPDGERVQVCCPPVVAAGTVSLTIRRPPGFVPTVDGLFATGPIALPARGVDDRLLEMHAARDWRRFFPAAVRARKTIILAGDTGSGKTTVAKALGREIPAHERLVTIEDTAELTLPHRNLVSLRYSKGEQGIAKVRSEELIEAALRMRPDRIMLGELRDGAAFTFVRSVAAGHPGSITTCHARSAEGAFDALRLMVKQHEAGRHMADADVLAMLRDMVDVVALCERRSDGSRGVSEVYLRGAR